MKYPYDIVVKRAEEGLYVAHCPSLPGCIARGPTPADATARVKEIVAAYMENHSRYETRKCSAANCEVAPIFHFTRIESRCVVTELFFCDPHAETFFAEFRSSKCVGSGSNQTIIGASCVELEMAVFHIGQEDSTVCLYAHEVGGTRRICILTDGWAWWALIDQLTQMPSPRPRTHASWFATITELGGELQDAVLDRVEGDDWWAAKLHIAKDGHLVGLDVRASDAFIVAAIAGVPVFVDDMALERYADRG